MTDFSRRDFIKTVVASTVATSLFGSTILNALALHPREEIKFVDRFPMHELYTTCGVCDSNCAVKAYVKDGVLRFLEGNPDDLQGGGKMCGKGIAGGFMPYAPDRLKYPLMRTNPEKGVGVDPGWMMLSWDEALDTVAEKLKDIKDKFGSQAILFVARPSPFIDRLIKSIGTPNRADHRDTCFTTHLVVQKFTLGEKLWSWDLSNARYILSLGWDQPSKAKVVFLRRFAKAKERGAKVVVLNPMVTLMSSSADEWITITPGTDLAFALAMINVIITENLYDKVFIERYTNFKDYEGEIRTWIESYTPEWASEITGIPSESIRRIAREFATTKPSIIPIHKRDAAGPNYVNSWRLAHAIVILNALVGSIDNWGGWLYTRNVKIPPLDKIFPPPPYPTPPTKQCICGRTELPLLDKTGAGIFTSLADNIIKGRPYEVKAAVIHKYNILSFPNPKRMVDALKKLEFVAVIDILPSEMAQLADIVLPECTYLEGKDYLVREYSGWYPQISVRQPVIEPLYEGKGLGWICCELGRRIAPEYFKKPDGTFFTPDEYIDKSLQEAIGLSFSELAEKGVWSRPEEFKPYAKLEEMVKVGNKIEIYGKTFEKYGYDPLPSWQPKLNMPNSEYPFYLLITRPPVHRHGTTTDNPYLLEVYPENVAIMNTDTANDLSIKSLDWVWIESKVGKVKVKAMPFEGIRRDCICLDHGFGHWSEGLQYGVGRGTNDGDLIPDYPINEIISWKDPSASACMSDICVKVYKA
ncbi:MAG: molybdopterin-containing oxidoreductase family protein [Candidatus Bathyarchaeia archaeon]